MKYGAQELLLAIELRKLALGMKEAKAREMVKNLQGHQVEDFWNEPIDPFLNEALGEVEFIAEKLRVMRPN